MQQPPHGYDPNQYPQQHYQQPPPQGPPPKPPGMSTATKVVLGLLGLGVLFFGSCAVCVAIGAGGAANAVAKVNAEQAAQKQAAVEAKDEAKGEASGVQIEALLSEYKDNEVRADANFKGKYIRVTGKVDDIKKDILDSAYVTIGTGKQFEIPQVQCMLDKESVAKAAQLSKGASLTVVGRVEGLMVNVLIRDCSIQ